MKTSGDHRASRIDNLESLRTHPENRKQEIDALNELAWEFRISQVERAYEYSQKAGELSQQGEFTGDPYVQGLADSFTNQAFLETYSGRLDSAVSKCLRALELVQEVHPPSVVKIWFVLGWNSYFLGDYPAALENGMKALKLAREFGDDLHEAWALDALIGRAHV